jgi:alkylation response protein AidB-like acyl-CoA dehydrogenase
VDFDYSDTQRMLLDSAERFLGERYTLRHRQSLRAVDDGLDRDAWRIFAELGWLALPIPEAHGGLGGTIEDVALLASALGARLVTEPFTSTAVLATHILANAPQPRSDLLRTIAGGEARVALAHDEPNQRYDYSGERSTHIARRGHSLVIEGQKMIVLDAPSCDRLIVTAQMEGYGLVLALVGARAGGVVHSAYTLVDGSRAADVRFEGAVLSPDDILAIADEAQTLLLASIDRATLSLLAQAVGSMETCLQICSAYLKERHQFGQSIGKFQALQHLMADMFIAVHQARSALYHALSNAEGLPAQRARAVSLAKLSVGEAAQFVSRQAIQLHGGYGLTDEFEVSHHYRRLFVIEKLYGDIEFHVRRLAMNSAGVRER